MRRTVRIVMVTLCALAVTGLFGAVVRQSWLTNAATADFVVHEAHGAEMLHPMTTVLANMVQAQSAAVRGERVDAAPLRKALASVAEEDEDHGVELQTRQRLADLRSQVEAAIARNPTGREAYATYSSLVTLTVDLIRRIGDTSHLIHDPELDSYYLMDAAIVRLPDAVVLAGKASDLVTLAGGSALSGEDAVKAAVARFGVSTAAEQVNAGLTKSVDYTSRAQLGSNIAERLDAFKAAADNFAPPTMLAELANPVDAATLAANARRVSAAASPLAHLLLGELQALLTQRGKDLADQRRFTLIAAMGFAGLGLIIAWLLVFTRSRLTAPGGTGEITGGHARLDRLPLSSLTYPRELLEAEELVHAGQAGKSRKRGDGDAR
jgi:hypothetical protein